MRPLHPKDAIKAISITDKYPQVHGAPVHIGLPELIGVDLGRPYETLGPISIEKEEIPLFWAKTEITLFCNKGEPRGNLWKYNNHYHQEYCAAHEGYCGHANFTKTGAGRADTLHNKK